MLVQGASGGVATALVQLGHAAGMQVWVTGRSDAKGIAAGFTTSGGVSRRSRGCYSRARRRQMARAFGALPDTAHGDHSHPVIRRFSLLSSDMR